MAFTQGKAGSWERVCECHELGKTLHVDEGMCFPEFPHGAMFINVNRQVFKTEFALNLANPCERKENDSSLAEYQLEGTQGQRVQDTLKWEKLQLQKCLFPTCSLPGGASMDVIEPLVFLFSSIDRSNPRLGRNSINTVNLGNPFTASNHFFSTRGFMLEVTPMNAMRAAHPSSNPLT